MQNIKYLDFPIDNELILKFKQLFTTIINFIFNCKFPLYYIFTF